MNSELNRADASRYISSGRGPPGYPPMGDLTLPRSYTATAKVETDWRISE
jgi:hypothetical protein